MKPFQKKKGKKKKPMSKTGRDMAKAFGILPGKRKLPNVLTTKGMMSMH